MSDDPLDKLEAFRIATEGRDGTNGKLSILRSDIDGMRKFVIAVIVALVTSLGGMVGVAWKSASEAGRRDARIDQLSDELKAQSAAIDALRQTVWGALFKSNGAP